MACTRRTALAGAASLLAGSIGAARAGDDAAAPRGPEDAAAIRRWYEAAEAMRRQAESWGDQSYGAVLVKDGRLVGFGPSGVVLHQDPQAHAEREALRDAAARLGAAALAGSVLVSTSRPCPACERAAARAGVARMIFGPALTEAGPPQAP